MILTMMSYSEIATAMIVTRTTATIAMTHRAAIPRATMKVNLAGVDVAVVGVAVDVDDVVVVD